MTAYGPSALQAADTTDVLGLPISRLPMKTVLEHLTAAAAGAEAPAAVFTPNPEMVVASEADPTLRQALLSADLLVADGIGLVWACRVLGRPVPERIPGIDLATALLERLSHSRRSVYLLGSLPEVVEQAATAVEQRFPGLQVAGFHHGYFAPQDETETHLVETIAAAAPDALLLGMGVPKEQRFWYRHRCRLEAPVVVGAGGTLDVLAGRRRRAPAWVRRLHCEWLYRLLRQPRRWRRQLRLPAFVWRVLRQKLRQRRPDA